MGIRCLVSSKQQHKERRVLLVVDRHQDIPSNNGVDILQTKVDTH